MNKKRWIIGGGCAVMVMLLVGLYFVIQNAINSATVSVTVAPSVAAVRIGEREYGAIGTYRMAPGEYEVEVTAEGFKSKSGKLVAKANESVSVQLYLEPENDDSDWYKTHPEDALIMGEVKNVETVKTLKSLGEQYPILNKLPYTVDYYTRDYSTRVKFAVSYEITDEGFLLIVKDYTGGNKERALAWISSEGVDTAKVVVKYEDLSSEYHEGYAG